MLKHEIEIAKKKILANSTKNSANIYSKTNTAKNIVQNAVNTALTSMDTVIANNSDQLDLQIGGNIVDTTDITLTKTGTPATLTPGTWTQLNTATSSSYKYRIESIDLIVDFPQAIGYVPLQQAFWLAFKTASFSPTTPTNFNDINTSMLTIIPPTLNAGAPGVGTVFPLGFEPTTLNPAGAAPPEANILVPNRGIKRIRVGKAGQTSGLSIWAWNNPVYPMAVGQFIQANIIYNTQSGGSI